MPILCLFFRKKVLAASLAINFNPDCVTFYNKADSGTAEASYVQIGIKTMVKDILSKKVTPILALPIFTMESSFAVENGLSYPDAALAVLT